MERGYSKKMVRKQIVRVPENSMKHLLESEKYGNLQAETNV